MRLLRVFSLLFFLAIHLGTIAQNRVALKIFSLTTSSPILAEIFIYNDNTKISTNANGEVTFSSPENSVRVTIFSPNHKKIDTTLTINQGVNKPIRIELEELSKELLSVRVTANKTELFALGRMRKVDQMGIYSGKKNEVINLDKVVGAIALNNSRQIYSQVVGLNIYDNGDAGLQLNIGGRGLNPNRTQSFNTRQNGYDISADVLGYPESYYTPPSEALQQIQVVRGASSLQYGTQFGGLVNFKFKPPNPKRKLEFITRQSVSSFSSFSSFNSISGTSGKYSYYAFYNLKNGNGFRPNSKYSSHNVFIHFGYKLSEKTSFSGEYTFLNYLMHQPGGLTDYQFYKNPTFSNRSRNWFKVNWNLYSFKIKHKFSSRSKLSVSLFGLNAYRNALGFRENRVSQQDDFSSPREFLQDKFNNWGVETRFLTRYNINKKPNILLVGAKYYNSFNFQTQGPGTTSQDPDFIFAHSHYPYYKRQSSFIFPNQNFALFAENIIHITDRIHITPGARMEYIKTAARGAYKNIILDLSGNPILNRDNFDSKRFERKILLMGLGIEYKPSKRVEMYANFSQNYRSITFSDIRVVNPNFQINPNISDERGFNTDIGLRGTSGSIFSYDFSLFGLKYDNRIGETLKEEERVGAQGNLIKTGRIIRYRDNIGSAFIYGLEIFTDWNIQSTFFNTLKDVKARLFLSSSFTESRYLAGKINIVGNQVEFIPFVNLKTGVSGGYKNFNMSFQYTFLSKQFSDATNTPQNVDDNQKGILGTIPAYGVADLSIVYSIKKVKIETGINNLFNRSYFTRRATGYPGPGIIPSQPLSWYITFQLTL